MQKKQWGSCQFWGCRPAGQGAGTREGTCRRSSFPAQRISASHPWTGHKGSGALEEMESRKGVTRGLNMSECSGNRTKHQLICFTSATVLCFLTVWYLYKRLQTYTHLAWGVNAHMIVLTKAWWRTKPLCTHAHNTSAHKAASVCDQRSIIRPQNAIKTHTAVN